MQARIGHWQLGNLNDGFPRKETKEDLYELKNLANAPKYAKTVVEMKKLLAKMPMRDEIKKRLI